MPPRVREIVARLLSEGFVLVRRGKGDHSIYRRSETGETLVLDGSPDHELPMPVWKKLKKRLEWND